MSGIIMNIPKEYTDNLIKARKMAKDKLNGIPVNETDYYLLSTFFKERMNYIVDNEQKKIELVKLKDELDEAIKIEAKSLKTFEKNVEIIRSEIESLKEELKNREIELRQTNVDYGETKNKVRDLSNKYNELNVFVSNIENRLNQG